MTKISLANLLSILSNCSLYFGNGWAVSCHYFCFPLSKRENKDLSKYIQTIHFKFHKPILLFHWIITFNIDAYVHQLTSFHSPPICWVEMGALVSNLLLPSAEEEEEASVGNYGNKHSDYTSLLSTRLCFFPHFFKHINITTMSN